MDGLLSHILTIPSPSRVLSICSILYVCNHRTQRSQLPVSSSSLCNHQTSYHCVYHLKRLHLSTPLLTQLVLYLSAVPIANKKMSLDLFHCMTRRVRLWLVCSHYNLVGGGDLSLSRAHHCKLSSELSFHQQSYIHPFVRLSTTLHSPQLLDHFALTTYQVVLPCSVSTRRNVRTELDGYTLLGIRGREHGRTS